MPEHEGHHYVGGTARFLPIDLDQIKAEQNLAGRGRTRGSEEQPPADADTLDAVEQEIASFIETELKSSTESYATSLHTLSHRVSGLDLRGQAVEIRMGAETAITDFRRRVHEGVDFLHNERRHIAEAESELERFRQDNRLSRPARYPLSRTLHLGVILLILVVETALNGVLFARGSATGILGGAVVALLVALINILAGAAIGRFAVPRLQHRRWLWRGLGLVVILFIVPAIVGFNIAVAHYRDALGGTIPEAAPALALASLKADFMAVKDVESWFLVILGAAFATIAAIDTYLLDDPYPGYGALWRRVHAAVDSYAAEKAALIAELTDVRDSTIEEMQAIRRRVSSLKGEFTAMMGTRDHLAAAFKAHQEHLESAANDLLRAYRDANTAARRSPKPRHFAQRWALPQAAHPSIDPFHGLTPAIFDDESAAALAALEAGAAAINAAYLSALERYQSIEQMTAKDFKDGKTANPGTPVAA